MALAVLNVTSMKDEGKPMFGEYEGKTMFGEGIVLVIWRAGQIRK